MDSASVTKWLSNIQPEDPSTPPSKRRKLSGSETYCGLSKSDPIRGLETVTPSQSPEQALFKQAILPEEEEFEEEIPEDMADNRQMPPPPSPSKTGSRRDYASEGRSNTSLGRSSSVRAAADKVESSQYRIRVLEPNSVFFKRRSEPLPADVATASINVLDRDTLKTSLTASKEAMTLLDALYENERADRSERGFLNVILKHGLFPGSESAPNLALTDGMPFSTAGLPRSKFPQFASISGPKPDQTYGYSSDAFPLALRAMCQQQQLFQPTTGQYFPFLIIEAKSQYMGNNVWQAQNQCAGGGTACVNAIANLQDQAHDLELPSTIQSGMPVTFSLAIDTFLAWLHVHWRDMDGESFFVQPVRDYKIYEVDELLKMKSHLEAIVDWGLGSRLEMIKKMLEFLAAHGSV